MTSRGIVGKRAEIRDKLPRHIQFSDLVSTHIRALVGLYDSVFFGGKIDELLRTRGIVVDFVVGEANDLVYGGNAYTFCACPRILEDIRKKLKATPRSVLQALIEHQIIHLLTMVCGTQKYPSDYHGSLFVRAAKKYFDHDGDVSRTELFACSQSPGDHSYLEASERSKYHKGVFIHRENSCYLNALLITILHNRSCFWRDRMLVDEPVHKKILGVWDNIDTIDRLHARTRKLFEALTDCYSELENGENIESASIREALIPFVSDIKDKSGKFDFYNVGSIYDTFCSLFPKLKFKCVDVTMKWNEKKHTHIPAKKVRSSRKSALTMWDFLDSYDNRGADFSQIMWNLFTSPVLVFLNGGIPRIRQFNNLETEYKGDSLKRIAIKKSQAFNSTILKDYELTGVITLQGVHPDQEGGTHYVSRFLGEDDKWYFYDDMGPVIERIDNIPEMGVWTEERGEMPAMYFYAKKKFLNR